MNCTGQCNTCNVDHSVESANRGHGISYSDKVKEYVNKVEYLNKDNNFNQILVENNKDIFSGKWGSPACGDIVELYVRLDTDKNTILDAKYLSTGCWGSISSSCLGCEYIINKKLFDINTTDLTKYIMQELELPKIKLHCSVFVGQCLDQIKQKIGKITKNSEK